MHRSKTDNPPAAPKALSLWGLLLALPAAAVSFGLLSTGQGSGDPPPPPTPPPPPPTPPEPTPPPTSAATLTQAQVDAIVARQRTEAGDKATAKLLADLGVTSIDDAKALVAAKKAADEKDLSDAQKATKRAEEATAKALADSATAAATTRRANVTLALAGAAVRTDRITQATTLLLADLPADADEKAIAEAVKAQTTAMPEFYATAGAGGVDLGGRGPNGSKGGKDSYAAGLADGKARHDAMAGGNQFLSGFPGWKPSGN